MSDYIDNVVLKLKRKYSKDELVASLNKKLSDAETEVGILKSERDEAIYNLNKVLKLDNEVKSRVGQLKIYQNMKSEVKTLREKCRKLELEKDKLFQKVVQLNVEKNQNEK